MGKKHPDEAIMMGGFLFFRYLQNERSDLLDFRAGDKWQIVQGWLRDRLEEINADAIRSRKCRRKISVDSRLMVLRQSSEAVRQVGPSADDCRRSTFRLAQPVATTREPYRETTLWRNAGDVLITMLPADIARIIDVTRIELLGGVVIDAADIER
jgi:hypothetical protein